MAVTMKEISRLSVAERIVLAEKIWESIPEESQEAAISPSDRRELDRRLDSLEAGKSRTVTWPEVKRTLRMRRK